MVYRASTKLGSRYYQNGQENDIDVSQEEVVLAGLLYDTEFPSTGCSIKSFFVMNAANKPKLDFGAS